MTYITWKTLNDELTDIMIQVLLKERKRRDIYKDDKFVYTFLKMN